MFKTKMTMIMLIVALFTSGLFAQYTSDLTGSGTVTASSILSGSTPAENAFDDDQWTHWESDGHQGGFHWVKYDFGSGQEVAITQYTLRSGFANYLPDTWQFQASNDDVAWIDLDSHSNVTDFQYGITYEYPIINTTTYRYYRINVTATNGSYGLSFSEIEMMGDFVNTAPVAEDVAVTTNENEAVSITLLGSDADGDDLFYVIEDFATNGILDFSETDNSIEFSDLMVAICHNLAKFCSCQ